MLNFLNGRVREGRGGRQGMKVCGGCWGWMRWGWMRGHHWHHRQLPHFTIGSITAGLAADAWGQAGLAGAAAAVGRTMPQ